MHIAAGRNQGGDARVAMMLLAIGTRRMFSTTSVMARQVTRSFPAIFARGGTSNGFVINRDDLPQDESQWQPILASAMGSPDSFGRQLNGMGSGISSTSKICVLSKSTREDADVDFKFVQVGIKEGELDVAGNCGNMSSVVGPVAWDEGLLARRSSIEDGEATVRIFNSNTSKIIHSTFSVDANSQKYEPCGDYSIDGVPGSGSRITLSFLDPAGAKTGKALPTGNAIDVLTLEDGASIRASLVDVSNPGVFVLAQDIGVAGKISADALNADTALMARLEEIRQAGAEKMGLDRRTQTVPKIVLLSKPGTGSTANIVCRALSMQQAHKAVPLTLALNLGSACRIPGTLPAQIAVGTAGKQSVTIEHASGQLEVGAVMSEDGKIESALLHRTARILMRGEVFYTVDEDS